MELGKGFAPKPLGEAREPDVDKGPRMVLGEHVGVDWDNGNYYIFMGDYGSCRVDIGDNRGYIGIMENKMETTI